MSFWARAGVRSCINVPGVKTATALPNVLPFLRYDDAPAAIEWLTHAFGFEEKLVVPGGDGAIFPKAQAAGAEIVRALEDTNYGSREYTARDPEGNLWAFGMYQMAAADEPA